MEGIFLWGIPNRIRLTVFKELIAYYGRHGYKYLPSWIRKFWVLRDVHSAIRLIITYWASTMLQVLRYTLETER